MSNLPPKSPKHGAKPGAANKSELPPEVSRVAVENWKRMRSHDGLPLWDHHAAAIAKAAIFDGQKNIFTPNPLPLPDVGHSFSVELKDEDGTFVYSMHLKKVNEIEMDKLHRLLNTADDIDSTADIDFPREGKPCLLNYAEGFISLPHTHHTLSPSSRHGLRSLVASLSFAPILLAWQGWCLLQQPQITRLAPRSSLSSRLVSGCSVGGWPFDWSIGTAK